MVDGWLNMNFEGLMGDGWLMVDDFHPFWRWLVSRMASIPTLSGFQV